MIAGQNFYDMFYFFYPKASATAYGQRPNIRLRPKVKIAPTVQHCSFETKFEKREKNIFTYI